MSVTLEHEAYVRFRYNLGSGPVDIINWQVKVRPGRWYTALATRLVISLLFLSSCCIWSTVANVKAHSSEQDEVYTGLHFLLVI